MKHMKKLIALALVAMTVLAVAVPAFASVTGYYRYLGGDGTSENIRQYQTGTKVLNLQIMLDHLGYETGPLDGDFGGMTLSAVMEYQEDEGLNPDGIVGMLTKRALWQSLGETAPGGCIPLY